jgi:cyclophilin family peptidyl-prolyl cis-trans isomerase
MRLASLLLCLLLAPHLVAAQDTVAVSAAPRVRVVTNAGSFVIELDRNRAPRTVEAFLKYVDSGFYSGVIFHRVVAGFVAQAGGFTADMEQKPVTENVFNESGNGLSNLRGTVGLARSTEPHSGTSQFYVNLADNVDLDPRPTRWGYAVFGWSSRSKRASTRTPLGKSSRRSKSRSSRFKRPSRNRPCGSPGKSGTTFKK